MQEGRIPKERRMDLIVPTWKRKGDVHDPGNYRGITLLSQVPKLLARPETQSPLISAFNDDHDGHGMLHQSCANALIPSNYQYVIWIFKFNILKIP